MSKKEIDLVIVGGGSAGMAAAISAYEAGVRDMVILERDHEPGGILLQCIHNGFGLHTFGEELSGPAYAERFAEKVAKYQIPIKCNTMVLHIGRDKTVSYTNPIEGYVTLQAKAIVLAMGCRERPRGAIGIPGERPVGIWTAGTAQRYLNMEGYLVGKRIFILGSGDIGLIMARRMTLEGAKVLGVAELMPYSNGLPRNMKQCLEDFDIPLYLSHTVTDIRGKERLTGITISQVDEMKRPLPGTEKEFDVDTLLLSVGLIPENALTEEADIEMHPRTKGAVVNESLETSVEGIFACGNVLHVHDLVDFVSAEAKAAGENAAKYLAGNLSREKGKQITTGKGVAYCLPVTINSCNVTEKQELAFRVTESYKGKKVRLSSGGKVYKEWKKAIMIPAEMQKVVLKKAEIEELPDCFELSVGEEE